MESNISIEDWQGVRVRVFVLAPAEPPRVKAHIDGEGFGYLLPSGTLDTSELNAGVYSTLCTLEQLLAREDGRRALEAWRTYDDSERAAADQLLKEQTMEGERRRENMTPEEAVLDVRREWKQRDRRFGIVEGGEQ